MTSNPENAFLTIDSGFPLTRLSKRWQTNTPFTYSFVPSRAPVILRQSDWTSLSTWTKLNNPDLLDVLLHDPHVARLYWAFSRIDPETRLALQRSPGLWSLLPTPGSWIFTERRSVFAREKCLCPEALLRSRPGGIWWGRVPDRRENSSRT